MGNTPTSTIDQSGVHKPDLATVLSYFTSGYQGVYGADTYLGADSQDGEFLGLIGAAVDDCNGMCVQAYNAYGPATAQGVGLSSIVKINNLEREVPTNSTAPILLGGVAYTPIPNGVVEDENNNLWSLPPNLTIPVSGQMTVTATCQVAGAIAAPAGTISLIQNPSIGWTTAVSTADAEPGAPVELDPQLRARQVNATLSPSQGQLAAVVSAIVVNVPNIGRIQPYENDGNSPDSNGVPGHSICIVIDGGDAGLLAQTIQNSKGQGCGTYGSTTEVVTDQYGVAHPVNWDYTSEQTITWALTIIPGNGFSLNYVALIQASLAAWTNSLGIFGQVQISRAYAAAYLQSSIQAAAAQLNAVSGVE